MRNEFVKILFDDLKQNAQSKNVFFLTGDLGYSVLEPIQEYLGKSFINVGVAEANMVSIAAGLAAQGAKVYCYSIAPFSTFRCLEQIRNDICYHNLDVSIVGIGVGYGYGALGPTHHANEDLAAMWSLPNMTVYNPSDLVQLKHCFAHSIRNTGPKYFRLGKGGEGELGAFKMQNNICEYKNGKSLTVLTSGLILSEVLKSIMSHNITDVQVLAFPFLKPFPNAQVLEQIRSRKVLVVEELSPYGGFSGHLAKVIMESKTHLNLDYFEVISSIDEFARTPGSATFQRTQSGLSAANIARRIKSIIENLTL